MLAGILQSAAWTSSMPLRRMVASQACFLSTSCSVNERNPCSSSQVYLNPERKRKLISLYHQAENFLTYENLSQEIDAEFRRRLTYDKEREEDRKDSLAEQLRDVQHRAKMITFSEGDTERLGMRFAKDLSERNAFAKQRRVKAALNGLDDSFKPGLEKLDEELSKPKHK